MVSINKMRKLRGLPKLKKPNNVICKHCQLDKMAKSCFKSKNHTCNEILELVHIDLCETITPQSYYGAKYFILLFDDYSRMMIVM